jgi:microcompartment protein CcmL/EutN
MVNMTDRYRLSAIGFLEFSSIAKGIEATDAVLKAADVTLIFAAPVCPGKYSALFAGEVSAVEASMEAGRTIGDSFVVDSVVISGIHPHVIQAIGMSAVPRKPDAIGVMEFFSITAAIHAADAAVKAADVDLLDIRLGTGIGGKSYVILSGEVAAVTESVNHGTAAEGNRGLLVESVVIPNPSRDLFENLL